MSKRSTNLRLVPPSKPPPPRRYRPSVIVDRTYDPGQRMTFPLPPEELDAHCRGPVPYPVWHGMWIAAWARAEFCPLDIERGTLAPHTHETPSDDLYAALGAGMPNVIGSLFFAIPLLKRHDNGRVFAATWPLTWCSPVGATGRN
jgi:hypothetical protein